MAHFSSSVTPAAEGVCGDLPAGGSWAGAAGLGCNAAWNQGFLGDSSSCHSSLPLISVKQI